MAPAFVTSMDVDAPPALSVNASASVERPRWGARGGGKALVMDAVNITDGELSHDKASTVAAYGDATNTRRVNLAFSCSNLPSEDVYHGGIVSFVNSSNLIRGTLHVDPSGRLMFSSGILEIAGGEAVSTPAVMARSSYPVISPRRWHFLEIHIDAGSTVDATVYLDGTAVFTAADMSWILARETGELPDAPIRTVGLLPFSAGDFDVGSRPVSQDATIRAVRDIVLYASSGATLGQADVTLTGPRTAVVDGDNVSYGLRRLPRGTRALEAVYAVTTADDEGSPGNARLNLIEPGGAETTGTSVAVSGATRVAQMFTADPAGGSLEARILDAGRVEAEWVP